MNRWVASDVVDVEVSKNPDEENRSVVFALLRFADERLTLDEVSTAAARQLTQQGIGAMDALHLAIAEHGECDVLLTTDDDFIRRAKAVHPPLHVRVENPVRWILEFGHHGA